ncbi:MAG: c-type cytochrome biogenesis protein CcmI [Vicinamibacteria bacterium]
MSSGILFWLIAFALVVATLAALVVPLLRRSPARSRPAEADAAAAIYRDQSRQLDDDVAVGVISADERERAHEEIVARLGDELATPPEPAATASPHAAWIAAIVIVALLPATALLAYLVLGSPQAIDAGVARQRLGEPEIFAMVERLAERMKAQPDDPKGWLLLGRSMGALQRFKDSADAYAQAAARQPNDADVLADWADAQAMAQGRALAGKPTEIIERALAIDPKHPKALALAASAAMERRDDTTAIRHWNALLATLPPDSEHARDVRATIAQLGGKAVAPAPSATAAAASGRTSGRVIVAPALASRVPPQATLFVFARAVQGSRMPLAVIRKVASDLPLQFVLDDSMAMAPGVTLSSAREVVIEARVSASGSATPTSGDRAGESGPVTPGATGIVVTINRIVP